MILLDTGELLWIAERALGAPPVVRDLGLLEAAAARPRASLLGNDAYPTLDLKAAALMHSLARNHPLVDGNKRLALAAVLVLLDINGVPLTLSEGEAYDLTIAVATGALDDVEPIALALRGEWDGFA